MTSFVITASADIGGTITPYGTTGVNSGANQTFTIAPNAGYNVATVLVDGVSQGAVTTYTFTSVTANHTIRATFAQNPITAGNNYDTSTAPFVITASADIGGTITPYGTTGVNDGANQTFTITPNAGYDVATVLVDGVSQGAVTTYTFTGVTANHTIRATFAQNPTAGNNYDTSTFETSDDGWAWHALAGSAVSFSGKTNVYAHTGNYSYQLDGAADYPDTGPWYDTFMVKTLNLRPGTMTFWARSETGIDHIKVTIGNTTVLDWTAVGTSWVQQSITVTQTGPLEVRIYSEYSADPSVPLVDDIVIPVQ